MFGKTFSEINVFSPRSQYVDDILSAKFGNILPNATEKGNFMVIFDVVSNFSLTQSQTPGVHEVKVKSSEFSKKG